MPLDLIVQDIEQYGYAALFFFLWLGIVGMPIPDEVIVMSGGFVTSLGILKPIPAFFLTYAGVISGLSIGYAIGRAIGSPALNYLMRKEKMGKYVEKAHKLIHRYGILSLVVSYFFPVVRHVVPYIVGMNKLSFAKYALFSYTTGFVWTVALFMAGRYFGQSIGAVSQFLTHFGTYSILLFALILLIVAVATKMMKQASG